MYILSINFALEELKHDELEEKDGFSDFCC